MRHYRRAEAYKRADRDHGVASYSFMTPPKKILSDGRDADSVVAQIRAVADSVVRETERGGWLSRHLSSPERRFLRETNRILGDLSDADRSRVAVSLSASIEAKTWRLLDRWRESISRALPAANSVELLSDGRKTREVVNQIWQQHKRVVAESGEFARRQPGVSDMAWMQAHSEATSGASGEDLMKLMIIEHEMLGEAGQLKLPSGNPSYDALVENIESWRALFDGPQRGPAR